MVGGARARGFDPVRGSSIRRPLTTNGWLKTGADQVLLCLRAVSQCNITDMLELNPVRQRIADLQGRLDALRGYL